MVAVGVGETRRREHERRGAGGSGGHGNGQIASRVNRSGYVAPSGNPPSQGTWERARGHPSISRTVTYRQPVRHPNGRVRRRTRRPLDPRMHRPSWERITTRCSVDRRPGCPARTIGTRSCSRDRVRSWIRASLTETAEAPNETRRSPSAGGHVADAGSEMFERARISSSDDIDGQLTDIEHAQHLATGATGVRGVRLRSTQRLSVDRDRFCIDRPDRCGA